MASTRVGLWLVGAKGGVATTLLTGLAGLRSGAVPPVGLVTARPPFDRLGLVDFADIVVGGHDIRTGALASMRKSTDISGRKVVSCAGAQSRGLDAGRECVRAPRARPCSKHHW